MPNQPVLGIRLFKGGIFCGAKTSLDFMIDPHRILLIVLHLHKYIIVMYVLAKTYTELRNVLLSVIGFVKAMHYN